MSRRLLVFALLSVTLPATAGATPARATGSTSLSTGSSVPLRAYQPESQAQHERDHAAIARFKRKVLRMTPGQRRRTRLLSLGAISTSGKARRLADQVVGPPERVGAWTTPPFKAPTYAINGVMLPTGRVLIFSMGDRHGTGDQGNLGQDLNNDGAAAVWDPGKGDGPDAFREVDPPPVALEDPQHREGSDRLRPAPIFCAGQVQLSDGRVLVAGGNLEAGNGGFGLKLLYVFDPYTERWITQRNLQVARWYPTLTRLPSGRVTILAGQDETGVNTPTVEVYPSDGSPVPGIDTSAAPTMLGTSAKGTHAAAFYYPHAYVLSSGKLAVVGPTKADNGILDPDTWIWKPSIGFSSADGYPTSFLQTDTVNGPDRVFAMGGLTGASGGGNVQSLVSTYRPGIDKSWQNLKPLNLPRRNAPAVLLPDGTAVIVGGGAKALRTVDPMTTWPTRRQVELWDPVTQTWTLGPAQQRPRGYHSIAMLLPDGRVMSSGDDAQSVLFDNDLTDKFPTTIELYSPPYLFKGPRPVITSSPARVGYDDPFSFTVAGDASQITRVTMVAPSSITHALDMNQRQLDLRVTSTDGNVVSAIAPPTAAAAPPGDYMLFALNGAGVPSVAKWVRVLPASAPNPAPGTTDPPVWTPCDTLAGCDATTPPASTPTTPPGSTPTTASPPTTPPSSTPTTPPTTSSTPATTPTTPPTTTPVTTPTTPVVKGPRPWWWPWPLPW